MATAFELISDTTLTSAAASISASVSTDYRRFRLTLYVLKDATAGEALIRFNADSGANYTWQLAYASATTAASSRVTGSAYIPATGGQFNIAASSPALCTVEVEKPLASTPARTVGSTSLFADLTTDAVALTEVSGEWSNTADLISSVAIVASAGNFAAGTRLLVEGAQP